MAWMSAIEQVETVRTQAEAEKMLAWLQGQSGFVGGRVLPPSSICAAWRVQAFSTADGVSPGGWLPDGCRLVTIPPSQRKLLGLN